jgi:elongation factor P
VFRKQMRKPVNQTKLKNLITGKVVEHAFHQAETIDEADIEEKDMEFIYARKGECWFSDPENKSNRVSVSEELVGETLHFLKQGATVQALIFDEKVIGVVPPIKVDLKVTEAPPSTKGNTAQGGSKQVTLETGATINVPLFVNEGDIVRINTETGEYVERVEKR